LTNRARMLQKSLRHSEAKSLPSRVRAAGQSPRPADCPVPHSRRGKPLVIRHSQSYSMLLENYGDQSISAFFGGVRHRAAGRSRGASYRVRFARLTKDGYLGRSAWTCWRQCGGGQKHNVAGCCNTQQCSVSRSALDHRQQHKTLRHGPLGECFGSLKFMYQEMISQYKEGGEVCWNKALRKSEYAIE